MLPVDRHVVNLVVHLISGDYASFVVIEPIHHHHPEREVLLLLGKKYALGFCFAFDQVLSYCVQIKNVVTSKRELALALGNVCNHALWPLPKAPDPVRLHNTVRLSTVTLVDSVEFLCNTTEKVLLNVAFSLSNVDLSRSSPLFVSLENL